MSKRSLRNSGVNDQNISVVAFSGDVPSKKRKTRNYILQLKSDLTPQMLTPKRASGGMTSRFGREIRCANQSSSPLANKTHHINQATSRFAARAQNPKPTNKRKVRYIFSIHRIQSNPYLRFLSNHQSTFSSPIDKLIALNKNGLTDFQHTETDLTATIDSTVEDSVAAVAVADADDAATAMKQIDAEDDIPCYKIAKRNEVVDLCSPSPSPSPLPFEMSACFNNDEIATSIYESLSAISIHESLSVTSVNESKDFMEVDDVQNDVSDIQTQLSDDHIETEWKLGEVVWAAMGKYPFWPALLSKSTDELLIMDNKIHVKFLSDNGRTAWINRKSSILLFKGYADFEMKWKTKPRKKRKSYGKTSGIAWKSAIAEANLLTHIQLSHRINFYDTVLMVALRSCKEQLVDPQTKINNRCDTPQTFDTAYSSMQQSASPASSSSAFNDLNANYDFNKKKRIENYLVSVANSNHQINVSAIENDAERTQSNGKSMSPASSFATGFSLVDPSNEFIDCVTDLMQKQCLMNCVVDEPNIFKNALNSLWLCTIVNRPRKGKSKEIAINFDAKTTKDPDTASEHSDESTKTRSRPIRIPIRLIDNDVDNFTKVEKAQIEQRPKSTNLNKEEQIARKMKEAEEMISSCIIKQYPSTHLFKELPKEQVCRCCFKLGTVFKCNGKCGGYYHRECLKKIGKEITQVLQKQDWYAALMGRDDSVSSKTCSENDFKSIKCQQCSSAVIPNCFVCSDAGDERIQCTDKHCDRTYHIRCLKYWPQEKNASYENKSSFVCPCHTCHTCISPDIRNLLHNTESQKKLIKCLLCPATYHRISACIPAGSELLSESQLVCPRHYYFKTHKSKVNINYCSICSVVGGHLICCETCPYAFHQECLNIQLDEHYICEECESGRMPLYGEIVWTKYSVCKWWPAIIIPTPQIPEHMLFYKPSANYFCVYFFGTHDFGWTYRANVYLYQEDDSDFRVKKEEAKLKAAIIDAKKWCEIIKETTQKYSNPKKPPKPTYIRIKSNRPVPPVKLMPEDFEFDEPTVCSCKPTDPKPCGVDSGCINSHLSTECDPLMCPAKEKCENQRFNKGSRYKLEVRITDTKGWGLFALEDIPRNEFIIEYIGEVINANEFDRRYDQTKGKKGHYYFLSMGHNLTIDAGPRGNDARFINHSCDPNCATEKWTVQGEIRIGIFSKTDISANTELTFNYNWGNKALECNCGAQKCRGYL